MFWLVFGLFGLLFVPIIIMFIALGVDKKHKIVGALICFAIWWIFSLGLFFDAKSDAQVWNGGYCDCGTHWELRGASKDRYGHETKYYSCPNCHAEIEQ